MEDDDAMKAAKAALLPLVARRTDAPDMFLDMFGPGVVYPQGGDRLLLTWRSEWEGSNVILARDEAALLLTWRRTVERQRRRNDRVEPVEFRRITIVSLPQDLVLRFAANRYRDELRNFGTWLSHRVQEYRRVHDGHCPPNTSPCAEYRPPPPERDDEEWEPSDGHYDCAACFDGILFTRPIEETFWAQADEWRSARARQPGSRHPQPKPAGAVGAPPDPSRPVRYAMLGHGVGIHDLADDPEGYVTEPLFYFQGEPEPIPEAIMSFVEAFDRRVAEAFAARQKAADEARRAKQAAEERDLLRTLGGGTEPTT